MDFMAANTISSQDLAGPCCSDCHQERRLGGLLLGVLLVFCLWLSVLGVAAPVLTFMSLLCLCTISTENHEAFSVEFWRTVQDHCFLTLEMIPDPGTTPLCKALPLHMSREFHCFLPVEKTTGLVRYMWLHAYST